MKIFGRFSNWYPQQRLPGWLAALSLFQLGLHIGIGRIVEEHVRP